MRTLLALVAVGPILFIGVRTLWVEFQGEAVSGFNDLKFRIEGKKSRRQIESEFPLVVELFAILLAGNRSPTSALAHISARSEGAFAELLREAVQEIGRGANLSQALDLLSARIQSPMVRRFCDSLMIAVERGSPLVEVVNRQVEEVRNQERARLLEAAGKAEIAMMIPVVFLILPISVLFALWPSYFSLGGSMGI